MKSVLCVLSVFTFTVMELIFLQADALKCRSSSCNTHDCMSEIVECVPGLDCCFTMTKGSNEFNYIRGCSTIAFCKNFKNYEEKTDKQSIACCADNLCN
ncbi:hypothetical protein GDO86_007271 [Hymenochirus boettgeri]|uniref:UPAR/Ly6 domain-containing protein n=1 Tax=Hymenochirus boettgeri TaxID=247094 RepID=A0A8T2IT31_9PIPI|nr:hypothetical protein GDO86_007271 [Hymenochirus boettgeri]